MQGIEHIVYDANTHSGPGNPPAMQFADPQAWVHAQVQDGVRLESRDHLAPFRPAGQRVEIAGQ
jgi:hypothetical protein